VCGQFASSAKTIENAPVVNVTNAADPMIIALQQQLTDLNSKLQNVEVRLTLPYFTSIYNKTKLSCSPHSLMLSHPVHMLS